MAIIDKEFEVTLVLGAGRRSQGMSSTENGTEARRDALKTQVIIE
ncbi:hypothetical protein [Paenibacillus sp. J2TS4]|nr:hypothetical protein [Paenibacillus sp. J2TS4]GIP35929.1 hypothetical protein J2TS4_51390 [Paenibacillus sp. J2TS4]